MYYNASRILGVFGSVNHCKSSIKFQYAAVYLVGKHRPISYILWPGIQPHIHFRKILHVCVSNVIGLLIQKLTFRHDEVLHFQGSLLPNNCNGNMKSVQITGG